VQAVEQLGDSSAGEVVEVVAAGAAADSVVAEAGSGPAAGLAVVLCLNPAFARGSVVRSGLAFPLETAVVSAGLVGQVVAVEVGIAVALGPEAAGLDPVDRPWGSAHWLDSAAAAAAAAAPAAPAAVVAAEPVVEPAVAVAVAVAVAARPAYLVLSLQVVLRLVQVEVVAGVDPAELVVAEPAADFAAVVAELAAERHVELVELAGLAGLDAVAAAARIAGP
jgi:hypothetical protein